MFKEVCEVGDCIVYKCVSIPGQLNAGILVMRASIARLDVFAYFIHICSVAMPLGDLSVHICLAEFKLQFSMSRIKRTGKGERATSKMF